MALSMIGKRFLLNRTSILASRHQRDMGYIVLVPEIGEDPSGKNPLIGVDNLPEFNNFTIENCIARIGHQALDLEKEIKGIEQNLLKDPNPKDIFEDVIDPIDRAHATLEATWGVAKTLYLGNSSLMPTKSYLSIHDRARKASGIKFNNLAIYKAIQATESKVEEPERRKVLEKYMLEAKLNGVDMQDKKRLVLIEAMGKLAEKRQKFQGHVNKAIDMFKFNIAEPGLMLEFPPHLLQAMATDPKQPTNSPWKVTLQPYIVKSFFEYCPHHDHKWNVWQADTRKASGYSDKGLANSTLLEEIRGFREDQANLLGYKTFAEMSMQTKMIGSVENLQKTLGTLLDAARPAQEKEISELVDFATQRGFQHQFEIYDVPYWRRKQLNEKFGYDEEAFRDFFPSTKVVSGMFELAEKLFGIKIVERPATTWDEDVKYFDIFDANEAATPIGGFYIDLYSRDEEKLVQENTGWMVGLRNRSTLTETNPLSALIFSFPAPIYGKPSLLSLRDVQLLFFKFGQALQHLLTRANYSDIAGLSGMQWDMVEVTGNLMTHFLQDPGVLRSISCHYSTQDTLSDKRIAAIQATSTHMAGFSLCEELYLASLDLHLYNSKDFWLDIVKELYPQHFVFKLDKRDAHPCSQTNIVSGEWPAAYFSHLHARLIAADIYSAFVESKKGENVEQVGKRFRDTFLSYGGGEATFRKFRGRDPSVKALIKTLGIKKTKQ